MVSIVVNLLGLVGQLTGFTLACAGFEKRGPAFHENNGVPKRKDVSSLRKRDDDRIEDVIARDGLLRRG
jgi:hypothetical protein